MSPPNVCSALTTTGGLRAPVRIKRDGEIQVTHSKKKARGLGVALVGLVVAGFGAAPAGATQYLNSQYCGTPGDYSLYSAYSDFSAKQAGTAHSTGYSCGKYGVKAHYIVPTTGAAYWLPMQYGTWSYVQSPGYPVDKAQHDTYQSSIITTY